jgi:hypothetical protein
MSLPKEEKLEKMAAAAASLSGALGEEVIVLASNGYSASEGCSRADALSMANHLIVGMLEGFVRDKDVDQNALAQLLNGLTSFISDISELVETIGSALELPVQRPRAHPSIQ